MPLHESGRRARPSARIGRSRLTCCSPRIDPSVVTRAVSGPMSACTSPSIRGNHRQAHAVDRQAVARRQVSGQRGLDADAKSAGCGLQLRDRADSFNEAGEHTLR